MTDDRWYEVAGPHVVADDVDGEVIAIHLDSGAYFSFRGTAATVWCELLAGRTSVRTIVDRLCALHQGDRTRIAASVAAFLDRVADEGLVVAFAEPGPAAGADAPPPAAERSEFLDPIYEKHTDMEQFLLVDPIHEVDVRRWPVVGEPE